MILKTKTYINKDPQINLINNYEGEGKRVLAPLSTGEITG
jgi:hypothetical protein